MDPATWAIVNIDAAESKRLKDLPYLEFLLTSYWRAVSRLVKERDKNRCQRAHCRSLGRVEVHHLRYKHHGREHRHLSDLITLCERCHRKLHEDALTTRPRRFKQREKLANRDDRRRKPNNKRSMNHGE